MSLQGLVVFLIVLAAIAYVGSISYKKLAAFSPKKACGSDCDCGTKTR